MTSTAQDRVTALITRIVAICRARSGAVLLGYLLLTVAALVYSVARLQVDADTRELMSPELDWRRDAAALAQAFPQRARELVVVIDGGTATARDATRDALLSALRGKPQLAEIYAPAADPWFERNALLLQSVEQLDASAQALEEAQPFLGRLAAQPQLAAFADLLREAFARGDDAGVPLIRVSTRLADIFDALAAEHRAHLDWAALALGADTAVPNREFVLVSVREDQSPARATEAVRKAIASVRNDQTQVRIRLTGTPAIQTDEAVEIGRGVFETAWSSLLGVAVLIALALRSLRLTGLCLVMVLSGLVLTTGFATLVIGRLNLISAAFAALYIGLAIAFALHWCMRMIEFAGEGFDTGAASAATAADTGRALLLSALTTASAFYAFVPTRYAAVGELGLIAGSGLLIGFALTVTLLPALIERYGNAAVARAALRLSRAQPADTRARRHLPRTLVLGLAVIAALGSLALLPRLRFDHNPLHLNPAHTESYRTLIELMASSDTPMTASVLAAGEQEAQRLAKALAALPEVAEVRSAASFVPADQATKLERLADLQLSLGGGFAQPRALDTVDLERDVSALRRLADALRTQATNTAAQRLATALDAWLLKSQNAPAAALTSARDAVLGDLPALLARINTALAAQTVTLSDLPAALRSRWIGTNGEWRIEAIPAEDLDSDAALRRFVDAVRRVAPHATDAPVEFVSAARSVVAAFVLAFGLALLTIALLLRLLLGNTGDTLRALAPLTLGSLLLCAATVLLDHPLNMANVIALPLLLGTNVDAAIHLILRAREAPGVRLAQTSTHRAVNYLVLTELIGFASLILSPHRGIASLGLLFTLGLGLTLICILWLLPALLPRTEQAST